MHNMETNDTNLKQIIEPRIIRLDALVHGLVTGTVCGIGLFIATLWLVARGGDPVGPHLALLGQFFIGYTVTVWGSFVGLFYGFIAGFAVGWFVAFLYNIFLKFRQSHRHGAQS